jgi:hypothetical protein
MDTNTHLSSLPIESWVCKLVFGVKMNGQNTSKALQNRYMTHSEYSVSGIYVICQDFFL